VPYNGCDEEAGFGEGKSGDVLEFAELEVRGGFFVTAHLLARSGGGGCVGLCHGEGALFAGRS